LADRKRRGREVVRYYIVKQGKCPRSLDAKNSKKTKEPELGKVGRGVTYKER